MMVKTSLLSTCILLLAGCATTGGEVTPATTLPFLGQWSYSQALVKQTPSKRGFGSFTCYTFTTTGFTQTGYPPLSVEGTYEIVGYDGGTYRLHLKEVVTMPTSSPEIRERDVDVTVKDNVLLLNHQAYKRGC